MAREYQLISADSHLEISPDRWTDRVPAQYRDYAPQLIKLADGGDGVIIENRPLYVLGLAITAKPYEEHTPVGIRYEGSPGAGSPDQRVREQDMDGIDAEVMFTSAGNSGFWRGIRDNAAYCAVIHAYNEFLAEEYCAFAPDRLLATGIIPNAGVEAGITEMEYCARAGLTAVALGAFPNGKSYPSPEDDRFWGAALDLNMPITVHISMGQGGDGGPVIRFPREPGGLSRSANPGFLLTGRAQRAANGLQLAMAGVFDRFPNLRIYFAETNLGWYPSAMEQLDDEYERIRHWAERLFGMEPLKRRPSEYIREHCYFGFVKDVFGVRNRHEIGVDHVMWGGDFPHAVGDWPNSKLVLEEMFENVSEDERYQMLAGNAAEFFHLEGAR